MEKEIKPLISIISPVYNVEKYIKNFLISVNNQTYKEFELLLINDGSTDDTIKIAEDYLKTTSLNYKIINKKNGGQSSARNLGINLSNGDYFVTVDSDDVIQKDYIKNMINVVQLINCDVVICEINKVTDSNIFNEKNDKFCFEYKNGKEFFVDFIMHWIEIGPYSLLIKKKFINKLKLKYNEKSRYSEEYIFITNLLYNCKNVAHLKQRLYNYCLRNGSVSTGANINKIVNGLNEIKKSINFKDNDEYSYTYNNFAISRWILGTARFSSKNLNYKEYIKLLKKLNYKNEIFKLKKFPDKKIRVSAFVLYYFPFIAYLIFKELT